MKVTKGWDYLAGEYVTRIEEGKRKCTVRVGNSLRVDIANDDSLDSDYSLDEVELKIIGDKELAIQAAGEKGLRAFIEEYLKMKRSDKIFY
jgi:ASC-1-like (ASCH) protein